MIAKSITGSRDIKINNELKVFHLKGIFDNTNKNTLNKSFEIF